MNTRECQVCGNEFEDTSKFKPKQYCSDNCCNYNKFKNAIEDTLIKMEATKTAKTIIRGDMFRFANILSKRTVTKED